MSAPRLIQHYDADVSAAGELNAFADYLNGLEAAPAKLSLIGRLRRFLRVRHV